MLFGLWSSDKYSLNVGVMFYQELCLLSSTKTALLRYINCLTDCPQDGGHQSRPARLRFQVRQFLQSWLSAGPHLASISTQPLWTNNWPPPQLVVWLAVLHAATKSLQAATFNVLLSPEQTFSQGHRVTGGGNGGNNQ